MRKIYTKICEECEEEFSITSRVRKIDRDKRKFCSRKCFMQQLSKILTGIKRNPRPIGLKYTIHKENPTSFKKGFTPWNNGFKGYKVHTEESRRKLSEHFGGKNHWNWQGGKTDENKTLRRSLDYRLWRTAVFMRDDYTCQECNQRGGKLEADHIKPWSLYPELRYAIDNGRTLCRQCHQETDTWGLKLKYGSK